MKCSFKKNFNGIELYVDNIVVTATKIGNEIYYTVSALGYEDDISLFTRIRNIKGTFKADEAFELEEKICNMYPAIDEPISKFPTFDDDILNENENI